MSHGKQFIITLFMIFSSVYNDTFTLRHPSNYRVKLTIAHAIAQSVKMTLFERLVDDTINETKYIPKVMAESGTFHMSRYGWIGSSMQWTHFFVELPSPKRLDNCLLCGSM